MYILGSPSWRVESAWASIVETTVFSFWVPGSEALRGSGWSGDLGLALVGNGPIILLMDAGGPEALTRPLSVRTRISSAKEARKSGSG